MSTELTQRVETQVAAPPQSETAAIISMIERAARDPNVDIAKMERLFDMQQRAVAQRARAEFLSALATMQRSLPAVARKGTAHNAKKYARFEDVIETVKEPMADHGFSLTFRLAQDDKAIRVTGVLGHRGGHAEETTIVLPADASGSKNAVQAWGSSVSYGKRYVAVTLLGIATQDDNDGASAGDTDKTATVDEIKALIEQTKSNAAWFLQHFSVESLDDLTGKQRDQTRAMLKAKIAKGATNARR